MGEWKEYKLKDVIENFIDYRGKTPTKVEYGIPLITAKIIKDGTILTPTEFIEESKYLPWMTRGLPKKDDVLLTTEAPLGEVAMVKNETIALAQRVILLRGKSQLLVNHFLFYSLRGHLMQHRLKSRGSGSTVQGIKASQLKEILIPLPPLPEQKAIADVLSSLDNKIDNLRRQNETLEAIAQTLFKHWFIDFQFPNSEGKPYKASGGEMVSSDFSECSSVLAEIPKGWKVGKLGDEFKILMGQSPDGTSYNEKGEGIIFFQGRTDFNFRFPLLRLYTTEPKRMAEKFDVLVSVRAPVGDVNMAFENCCIGRGLASVNSNYKSYCFYKLKSYKNKFDIFEKEGTVFGSITKDGFNDIEGIIPNEKIVKTFNELLTPLDLKIFNNENQIQTLTKTRDTLLPKLMSGKIRVKE